MAVPMLDPTQRDRRVLWLGTSPQAKMTTPANGKPARGELLLQDAHGSHRLEMPLSWAQWLVAVLERTSSRAGSATTLSELEPSWEMYKAGAQRHHDVLGLPAVDRLANGA